MPRIRTIKPELPSDRKLASASRDARYTFVLLITQADDDGLVLGNARQLIGSLYPHDDDVDVATLKKWIWQLERVGAVRWRETVDGAVLLELTNWTRHQKVDHPRSILLHQLKPLEEARERGANDSRTPREGLAPDQYRDQYLKDRDLDQEETSANAAEPLVEKSTTRASDVEKSVAAAWNAHAERHGYPKAETINATRRRAIRTRAGEKGWLERLPDALAYLGSDQWHLEHPITIDTLLRPGRVDQYAEKYRASPQNGASGPAERQPSAGHVLKAIQDLTQTNKPPGQAPVRFIPRQAVDAMGPVVAAAYDAIGGAERILSTRPDQIGLLQRDFERELTAARWNGHGRKD